MSVSEMKVPSHITIIVNGQKADQCVYFRIKRNLELRIVMQAYADRIGEEMSIFRFLYDGIRIKPNQTPNELGLEDQDIIDAFTEQFGASASPLKVL